MPKKILFFLTIIAGSIFFFSRCIQIKSNNDPRGNFYAGSTACIKCHQQIYNTYLHTSHYHSASAASFSSIAGNFSSDSNTLFINDSLKVVMEKRGNIPYQVLYINNKQKNAERFDIVFGNTDGQTYLYWKNDLVYQLPVSYFAALHSWSSSPGYPSDTVIFDRPIYRRCFECHTSFIKESLQHATTNTESKELDKNSVIYNIDCERCHGPAATHVNFHEEYPNEKKGRYIISFASLSRSQKIDICAVCHSGNKNYMLASTFSFMPGDTLSHYMLPGVNTARIDGRPDVHGNQPQLLAMSKCFINSNMDCSTCHNPHINDRGNTIAYSQKCMACHTEANHNFCKMANASDISFLKSNCTTCHMPQQASNIIRMKTSNAALNKAVLMVNHHIAIYPEESKKIIAEAIKK